MRERRKEGGGRGGREGRSEERDGVRGGRKDSDPNWMWVQSEAS